MFRKTMTQFRPWVWVAALPLAFALVSAVFLQVGSVIAWILVVGLLAYLAWRKRRTPWWAVLGWTFAAWGGLVLAVFATGDDKTPVAAIVVTCVGVALGVAGLIVNGVKASPAPQPPA